MDKILEGNKIIAQFMCYWSELDNDWVFTSPITGQDIIWCEKVIKNSEDNLKYHASWDWLKPVIDKIGNIPEAGYVFKRNLDGGLFYTIDTVWNACVAFIEWYNTQNK